MATSNRVLSIDIGTSSVRMAEFEYSSSGNIVLQAFDWASIESSATGIERIRVVSDAIKGMLLDNNFTTNRAFVCSTGQNAFVRFVKLPPISGDEAKIRQVVKFEAEDKVPFALDEVSWDYQLIPSGEDGDEIEVMIVVMKNDVTANLTGSILRSGLKTELIGVSSAALLNVAKANNIGNDECVMLLDIGDRCSDLLFIDGDRFFSRSIPIAGHAITQQIMKEFKISASAAEEIKRKHGFVALGAGYEDPESEVAAVVSKIIRNVLTRLHNDINQTRSVFKNQYKGGAPSTLYLTGGSSVMKNVDRFFAEKLAVNVEFFNPFEIVHLAPRIEPEKMQPIAHSFATVVGIALHLKKQCPIEVNLIPEQMKKSFELAPRKKYLFASMVVVFAMFLLMFINAERKSAVFAQQSATNAKVLDKLVKLDQELDTLYRETAVELDKVRLVEALKEGRGIWARVMGSILENMPEDITMTSVSPSFVAAKKEESSNNNSRRSSRDRSSQSASKTVDVYSADEVSKVVVKGVVVDTTKGSISAVSKFQQDLDTDPLFTKGSVKIITTTRSTAFKNLTTFEIELALETPIILKRGGRQND